MTKNKVIFAAIVLCSVLIEDYAKAQQNSRRPFFYELHVNSQQSFGSGESHAEIAGGNDTMTYDKKKHLLPGFKLCTFPEFVAGYNKGDFKLQGTFGYFVQDIGLIEYFSHEYPFILADMFSVKVSVLYRSSKCDKKVPFGSYTGFFISGLIPVSYDMNDETKSDFGIKGIQPAVQINWGIYFSYSIRLSKKGLYAIAGASTSMPGTIGSIGKIQMQAGSQYYTVMDNIKMYSLAGFIGIGIHPKSGRITE